MSTLEYYQLYFNEENSIRTVRKEKSGGKLMRFSVIDTTYWFKCNIFRYYEKDKCEDR